VDLDNLKYQFVKLIPVFLLVYILPLVLFGILLLVHATTDVSFSVFLDDPLSYLLAPSYIGLASNLGVLFWCASASILIFASVVLRRKGIVGKNASFLLAFGLITALLAIDDLFMVHEAVGDLFESTFGSDNVGEGIAFAIYIFLFLFFTFKFIKVIFRTEYILFICFVLILAVNLFLDLAPVDFSREIGLYVEEIIKFVAIINWLAYTSRTALKFVKNPELDE